jgi:SAM-dependent methyltransferase
MLAYPPIRHLLRRLASASGRLWHGYVPLAEHQRGLDVGCGPHKRIGFWGADIYVCPGVDVICDLDGSSLPFADNSLDVVYASHVLEHIDNLTELLVEVARVLKLGGKLQIVLPYAGSLRAFQDPTHVRYFTLKTFEYYISQGARVTGWYMPKPFTRISKRQLTFGLGPMSLCIALLVNRSQFLLDLYESSALRIVPARDLQVELEK